MGFAIAVLLTGRQSTGARIMGLRLVDAHTGSSVSWQQAIVRAGTRQAWQALAMRVAPKQKIDGLPEMETLRSEVEAAQREYAEDDDAAQRTIMEIYQRRKVEPVRASCLPALLRFSLTLAIELPALWTPLKQALPDRLAGTVVVLDR
jgi:uncharacterized RDD family membrane protein YckC